MEVSAFAKYIRVSPQKARLVAKLVKGKKIGDALSILAFTQKGATRSIAKTLNSAVTNAQNREGIDIDTLVIKNIFVNEGPTLKRFRARAMGRGTRILKRTRHITVVLDEE
jgi:large subunit ribosomal protein L22